MRQILIIAGKELRDGMRNRWVVATTALLAALALTLAFLGAAPTGAVRVSGLAVTIVSLSSLSIFLVPLIALLLSYDAIVGEVDRGAMAGDARKIRRPSRYSRLCDSGWLWRRRASLAMGRQRRPERLDRLRNHGWVVCPSRRNLPRHRLSRQHAGSRSRHGWRRRHRSLALLCLALRYGVAGAARRRSRPHRDGRRAEYHVAAQSG